MHVVLSYMEALAQERVDFSNAAAEFPRLFQPFQIDGPEYNSV